MHRLIIIFTILSLISCKEERKSNSNFTQKKQIEVDINHTIETFMILRSISEEDPLFQYRKPDFKGKPMLYDARIHFSKFKNHEAVSLTQKLLAETDGSGGIIIQGLLHFSELPEGKQMHSITDVDWIEKQSTLTQYVKTLKNFYFEAKVEEFIKEHQPFYDGSIKEAKSYIDDRLIPTMETYFGKENKEYKVILMPMFPFGSGIGANVGIGEDKIFYQILGTANDIEWFEKVSDYSNFGYSGEGAEEYYRDLVIHEFCHSFITDFISTAKWKEKIKQTDSLYVTKLDSMMKPQGYQGWWSFVNEHLVRVGEIRVAKEMGVESLEKMREYNVYENGFILIPEAEKLMEQYENNRDIYKNIELFIPQLIDQLSAYNREEINEKLQQLTLYKRNAGKSDKTK